MIMVFMLLGDIYLRNSKEKKYERRIVIWRNWN